MSISLNKISIISFVAFVILISVDPTGSIFGLKELIFVFLLFLSLLNIRSWKSLPKDVLFILFICLSFPIWGMMVAILKNAFADSSYAFGHFKSFLFIFLFFFLKELDFNSIIRTLFIAGSIIAIITIGIFVIAQINPDLFSLIYIRSEEDGNIMMSNREYYGFSILGVYFKTGPFILFSYIYSLYYLTKGWKRSICMLLNLFALLIAGSRTPSLIVILITLIYLNDILKYRYFFRHILFLLGGFVFLFVVYKLATEKGEISNEIKYADFASYIDCIFTNSNVVWGAGLGSEFYSAGRGFLVSSTEQTYMDIFRIYGLPLGIILIVAVYYPALYFFSSRYSRCLKYKRFILAYVLYMILAGTNPLLISSTGMLVWAIGLTFVYKIKTNQLDICNNSIL